MTTCDDCGIPITEDQYERGDGFCADCAEFYVAKPDECLECSVCGWRGREGGTALCDFPDERAGWACPLCREPCAHVPMDEWEKFK